MIARKCLISGRVQGVFYRATVARAAQELGVVGHAHNLADGRVEVIAFTEEAIFTQFLERLWAGSTASKVTSIDVEEVDSLENQRPLMFSTG